MLSREERSLESAGNMPSKEVQGTICFLYCMATFLAHAQLRVHQNQQLVFCQAAFQLGGPQRLLVFGVVPLQAQDFALTVVEHVICGM